MVCAELLTHQFVAAGKLGIAGERCFHRLRLAMVERSRCMPGQQDFDIVAFAIFAFFAVFMANLDRFPAP